MIFQHPGGPQCQPQGNLSDQLRSEDKAKCQVHVSVPGKFQETAFSRSFVFVHFLQSTVAFNVSVQRANLAPGHVSYQEHCTYRYTFEEQLLRKPANLSHQPARYWLFVSQSICSQHSNRNSWENTFCCLLVCSQ